MLMIENYETPEDFSEEMEYRDLKERVDSLCEYAAKDKILHPETILRMFNRTEDLERLLEKHRRDRQAWLDRQKEAMYVD